jgi:AcrR family transcriptional regulator
MAQAATKVSPRRAEMVQAAAQLFSERGYHGTSIQHLADALGLQKGSLYSHIGSKEELLLDVVEEGANRFLDRAEEALARGGTAAERITRLLVGHIETAAQHLNAATVFLNEWRYLSPDLRTTVQSQRDRYEQMFRSVVDEGIASGEFRSDVDPRFAGLLLLSAGNWTYTWYRPGGDMTPQEIGHRFAELIVKGLKA